MSDDATHINVLVLRGWARSWDGLSQQLTSAQTSLVTELANLQLDFMTAGVTAIDAASGELLRSGIYATYVANAAEQADGNFDSIDHTTFATVIFGGNGGALDGDTEERYSEAINQPEHDPTIDGLDQASVSVPVPPPPTGAGGAGGGDPAWSAPVAPPPEPPTPGVVRSSEEPILVQGGTVVPDWSNALAPVPGVFVPGAVACPDGSIPFGEDGVAGPTLSEPRDTRLSAEERIYVQRSESDLIGLPEYPVFDGRGGDAAQ